MLFDGFAGHIKAGCAGRDKISRIPGSRREKSSGAGGRAVSEITEPSPD